jgi:hypothetical protein
MIGPFFVIFFFFFFGKEKGTVVVMGVCVSEDGILKGTPLNVRNLSGHPLYFHLIIHRHWDFDVLRISRLNLRHMMKYSLVVGVVGGTQLHVLTFFLLQVDG